MQDFVNWLKNINESVDTKRYGIELNFRSSAKEVLDAYAKITLGFVSAAMKNAGFHVKHVFEEEPYRIIVSNRNWDDGEWTSMVSWNPNQKCFFITKGFYNKDRKTISVQSTHKCNSENAADVVRDLKNVMNDLKSKPDRHVEKLKKVPLKRGPKK